MAGAPVSALGHMTRVVRLLLICAATAAVTAACVLTATARSCWPAALPRVEQKACDYHITDGVIERRIAFLQRNPTLDGNRIWEAFEPSAHCLAEKRVGRLGDGGKWTCWLSRLRKPCVIYSLGCDGDFSFEEELDDELNGKCEIITFDKRYYEPPRPTIKFVTALVSGVDNSAANPPEKTIGTIMRELNHSRVDLLKADIEGFEHVVIPALFAQNPAVPIVQMDWEFHAGVEHSGGGRPLMATSANISQTFRVLERHGFVLYHKEHNHRCPTCCEFAFLNKAVYEAC